MSSIRTSLWDVGLVKPASKIAVSDFLQNSALLIYTSIHISGCRLPFIIPAPDISKVEKKRHRFLDSFLSLHCFTLYNN